MNDATQNLQKNQSATSAVLDELMRQFQPTILDPRIAFEIAETRLQEVMKPAIIVRETI